MLGMLLQLIWIVSTITIAFVMSGDNLFKMYFTSLLNLYVMLFYKQVLSTIELVLCLFLPIKCLTEIGSFVIEILRLIYNIYIIYIL